MDPLSPITPGSPAVPSRRVPAVDRLRRISREGDRPEDERQPPRKSPRRTAPPGAGEGEDGHQGLIDVRV
jgi:hypothetical protein